MLVSEQLRKFIQDSGETRARIARESRIDYKVLKRFLEDKKSILLRTADKLAEYLDLEFVLRIGIEEEKRIDASTLSEQLHGFLMDCQATHYRISEDADVQRLVIGRFLRGKHSLQLKTVDRLAEYLDLTLKKKRNH